MARLDWQKARERERAKEPRQGQPTAAASRSRAAQQTARAEFVTKHGLCCFKCGAEKAEWAKTGISARGPWAVCAQCVSARS